MIKIGIECTYEKLRYDLLSNPKRYFFVLLTSEQAALCIRTCDSRGEEAVAHMIDGLTPDSDGNMISLFEDGIKDSLTEQRYLARQCCEGKEYHISSLLAGEISAMPAMVDWVMASVLIEGRHILLNTTWTVF